LNNGCPKCRAKCKWNENPALNRIIGNLPQECELCGLESTVGNMEEHLENFCEMNIAQCRYCFVSIMRKEQKQHEVTCTRRTVQCRYCSLQITAASISMHVKNECANRKLTCERCNAIYRTKQRHLCPFDTIICVHCNQAFIRQSMQYHNEHKCSERFVICTYCGETFRARQIYFHACKQNTTMSGYYGGYNTENEYGGMSYYPSDSDDE